MGCESWQQLYVAGGGSGGVFFFFFFLGGEWMWLVEAMMGFCWLWHGWSVCWLWYGCWLVMLRNVRLRKRER